MYTTSTRTADRESRRKDERAAVGDLPLIRPCGATFPHGGRLGEGYSIRPCGATSPAAAEVA